MAKSNNAPINFENTSWRFVSDDSD